MVDFVLNNLRRKIGEVFDSQSEIGRLPSDLDFLISDRASRSSLKRKTSLLRGVFFRFGDDFGIEHDVYLALFLKDNYAFLLSDHVGRHTHAFSAVSFQRVGKVGRRLKILRGGGL